MNTTFAPCPACREPYPESELSCPACRALRHSDQLKRLHAAARRATEAGDTSGEQNALGQMLNLLPAGSTQRTRLNERLRALEAPHKRGFGRWGLLGAAALLLWKFKWVLGFLLTKGKALLLGLTKVKTLFSMVIALGAYWALWGWQFALGFVLSIYVHEMGHVVALRKLGIPASAPMFIPFVGAFVRLEAYPKTPHDDAEVGLAGPIYGVGAAIACYAVYWMTGISVLGGIAHAGAWINLFNLIPVWQLDGGRGFNALNNKERWIATAAIGLGWFFSGDSMFLLLMLGSGYRVLMTPAPIESGRRALITYGGLIAVITLLAQIRLPELSAHRSGAEALNAGSTPNADRAERRTGS